MRKLAPDSFGAYIPKPYAFSGRVGYSVYKLSWCGSAMVQEENVDVDRHLNDMSENIVRSPVLYGNMSGRS